MHFSEKDHTGKEPFSSPHIKGILYPQDLFLLMLTLVTCVCPTSSFTYCALWKKDPHLRSRELCFSSLMMEYLCIWNSSTWEICLFSLTCIFGHWELLLLAPGLFNIPISVDFWPLPYILALPDVPGSSCIFPALVLGSAISPGSPGSFYWRMFLETKIWGLSVLTATA